MIDILGFWANVTLETFILLAFPAVIILIAIEFFIWQVTEDRNKARAFMNLFIEDSSKYEHSIVFKRWTVHDGFLIVSFLISGILSVVVAIIAGIESSKKYIAFTQVIIDGISGIAQFMAPVTGWIAAVIIVYILSIKVLRKLYKTYVRVEELLKKDTQEAK